MQFFLHELVGDAGLFKNGADFFVAIFEVELLGADLGMEVEGVRELLV